MEFIVLNPRFSVLLALTILALSVVVVWWGHRVYTRHLSSGNLYFGNRLLIVGILVIGLCHPAWRSHRVLEEKKIFAVAVDTSLSMQLDERSNTSRSRLEAVQQLLDTQSFIEPLKERYNLQLYHFDTQTVPVHSDRFDFTEEDCGLLTNMNGTSHSLSSRTAKELLAGILFLTDGRETMHSGSKNHPPDVPIYSIGVGSDEPLPVHDFEIEKVIVPERVTINSQVEVSVLIRAAGTTPRSIPLRLQLSNEDGTNEAVIASTTVDIQSNPDAGYSRTSLASLSFIPDATGKFRLTANVPTFDGEYFEDNNSKTVFLEVTDPEIPVLYIEGKPRFDYTFVKRSLDEDEFIQPTGVVRLGAKQFLIQIGAQSKMESAPAVFSDLSQYKVILLGEILPAELGDEFLDKVVDFVEKGGGLFTCVQANLLNSSHQNYLSLLPLESSENAAPQKLRSEFELKISRRGMSHPIFQGGLSRREPPVMRSAYRLPSSKAGASVLAHFTKDTFRQPAVLAQRYGEGRVLSAAFDSSWRWELQKSMEGNHITFFSQFWRQAIRWLAGLEEIETTPENPVIVQTDMYDYYPDEPVEMTAFVSRELYDVPPRVIAHLKDDDKPPIVFASDTRGLGNAYKYTAVYQPVQAGEHSLQIQVDSREGQEKEGLPSFDCSLSFCVKRTIREIENNSRNEAYLRNVSNSSGGYYFPFERAQELHALLPPPEHRTPSRVEYEFWNHWGILSLVCGLLCTEWAFRRRYERLKD